MTYTATTPGTHMCTCGSMNPEHTHTPTEQITLTNPQPCERVYKENNQ